MLPYCHSKGEKLSFFSVHSRYNLQGYLLYVITVASNCMGYFFVSCVAWSIQQFNLKGNNDMKKILLGTTTLIGAAALFSSAAFADSPKVTVGGYENFEVGVDMKDHLNSNTQDFNAENGKPSSRPQAFRSDTQV